MLSSTIRQLPWIQFSERSVIPRHWNYGLFGLSRPCEANLHKGGRDGTRNTYLLIDMHLDSYIWVQIPASCCYILWTELNVWTLLQRALDAHIPGVCATPLYASCTLRKYARIGYSPLLYPECFDLPFRSIKCFFVSSFLLQNQMLQVMATSRGSERGATPVWSPYEFHGVPILYMYSSCNVFS